MTSTDQLDRTFAALADPTRRAILARLAQGEATVSEIVRPSGISQPAISRHLRVLEGAGLISTGRNGQFRPRRMEVAPLEAASEWLERYRGIWAENFARLDAVLEALKTEAEQPEDPDETA